MKRFHSISTLRFACSALLAAVFCAAFLVRCATINHNLTGGPKDTLPPVIVGMTPMIHTTNFPTTGQRREIYIEFNEFVQLKDQQKEMFTSPQMKKKPMVTVRGRGIVIQIRDTLLEDQTYAINFGSSLRDNNEGNPLNSLRYVFSTGDRVDSMVCSGYTADGFKADSVSKSFIWFFAADSLENHPDYDSTIFKYKPSAIARAENNGIFIAQNLKPIPYRIYAIEDTNNNQLYDPSIDQVGFLGEDKNPAELPDFAFWFDSIRQYFTADPQLYFRMFTDKTFRRQVLTSSERPKQHQALLHFGAPNPEVRELHFDSIPADRVIYDPQTEGRDTVALWFNLPSAELPDTIRGYITYLKHDSINQLQEVTEDLRLAWRYIESKEEQKEREKQEREKERAEAAGQEYKAPEKKNPFTYKASTNSEVNPEKHLYFDFDYPLTQLDSTSIQLSLLEEEKDPQPVKVRFRQDTANLRRWHLEADWKSASKYQLYIPKGSIQNVAGEANDSIGVNYTTLDPEKFATVKIDFKARSGKNYLVQLLNSSGKLEQERRNVGSEVVQFNYVNPGEIKFRIVEDENHNGRWDTGNVVERRQPERAEFYLDPATNTELFATKANWEVEMTMDMNTLFAPVTMQSLIDLLEKRELQRLQKEAEERAKKMAENQHNHDHNQGGGLGLGSAMSGAMGGMGGAMSGGMGGSMGSMGSMGNMQR